MEVLILWKMMPIDESAFVQTDNPHSLTWNLWEISSEFLDKTI
jgi:hypothetical protein